MEYGITILLLTSVGIGAVYLLWGKPGSITAEWDRPTTWVAGLVDKVRDPVSTVLGEGSNLVSGDSDKGEGSYDPDSFDD